MKTTITLLYIWKFKYKYKHLGQDNFINLEFNDNEIATQKNTQDAGRCLRHKKKCIALNIYIIKEKNEKCFWK